MTRKQILFLLLLFTSMRTHAATGNSNVTRYLSSDNMNNMQEIYNPNAPPEAQQSALFKALGWVQSNNQFSLLCQKCGGYYDESHFPAPSSLSISAAPTVIKANPPVSYQLDGKAIFNNGVVVQQPGRFFYATHATLVPNGQTGKLDTLQASGGARIEQSGALILANSLDADLDTHTAQMQQVNYIFKVGTTKPQLETTGETESPIFTGYANGNAKTANQISKSQFTLHDVTYSTCAPTDRQWELEAQKIYIDQDDGEGHAINTLFKLYDVPVFYLPYFSFPTNDQRKSGFLYTMASTAPGGGLSLPLPYYLNLAPNYDDTFTPDIYTKRGVLFINNFRYLTASSSGNILAQVIPYDQEDDYKTRYGYTINDNTSFNPNWSGNINYNAVSDENFLSDFNVFNANQVLLNQSGALNYQSLHWNAQALVQGYQVVNTQLLTANRPYSELPSLSANGQYPNILSPFSFSAATSYVNFQKSPVVTGEPNPVDGQRFNFMPSVSLPLTASYGYLTPDLTWDSTLYTLENNLENGYTQTTPSIELPVFDIDSSVYFDRNLQIGHSNYTQTLTPRLFYLYVPYENQNNIPVFDSTINVFNFSQLFSTNRFSGLDRIGDANQISYALSTNINSPSGMQVLSAGLGQIYYFENRQVSLCQNTPGNPDCIQTENPYYNQSLSDAAGYFTYNFNPAWSFTTNVTYNPNVRLVDSQSYNFQYIPNSNDLFNIGWAINRQNYSLLSPQQILAGTTPPTSSLIDGSFVYSISTNWATVGSINYSIENHGVVSEFGGLQYNSCCWALRLMAYRYVVGNNPNTPSVLTGPTDTVFMVQFLLKGLGSGGDQMSGLLAGIPGYTNQLGF